MGVYRLVRWDRLVFEPLFAATMDAAEEAILNSLLAAQATTGFRGRVVHAVPLDRVRQLCRAGGVLAAGH